MPDWAVVLECAADDGPRLDVDAVERLVDRLADFSASALHHCDRYALQILLPATSPLEALRRTLDLHAGAVRGLDLPVWEVVRTEVMTVAEFEKGWDLEPTASSAGPVRTVDLNPQFVSRLYEVGRSLLKASTPAAASALLARFIEDAGGWVVGAEDSSPWTLPADISLGRGTPRFAAAEPFSTARLLLEGSLPDLVEDANRLVALITEIDTTRNEQQPAHAQNLPKPGGAGGRSP